MGTVMNGKVWSGACVNGKVVSGLAKIGFVFYRKPVSTYKRRIMVGDNIAGKNIYSDVDFSDFDYIKSQSTSGNASSDVYIIYISGNYHIRHGYVSFFDRAYVRVQYYDSSGFLDVGGSAIIVMLGTGEIEENNKVVYLPNEAYDLIVQSVIDNQIYRKIFIEDKNIRPLKVGDKIVAGTKIYFNYPDNYYEQWPADGTYNDVIRVGGLGSFYHSRYSSGAMSIILDGFASFFHLSEYIYETDNNGNVSTNKSYVEFTQDEGEVTYVDTNYSHDAATKYILVDTTTLGA